MTKDEAIEAIKMAVSQVEWEYPLEYAAAFDMDVEALKKQSKRIPVSERLPDKEFKKGCECLDDDQPKEWIYDGNGRPDACPLIEIKERSE